MYHRYLFNWAAFPFCLENCCYSLTLLDGAEGRQHISKELGHAIFSCHKLKDSWHTFDSEVHQLKLMDEASVSLC